MKISILAITHLSLATAQTPQRTRLQRRLKKDPDVNKMRNILLGVRDIDGTPISMGPEGATARMSMSMLEEAAITTAPPPNDIPNEIMQVFHDPDESDSTTFATDASVTTSIPKTIVEILEPVASKASKKDGGDELANVVNNEMSMLLSKGSKSKPRQSHHHSHEIMSVSPKAIKITSTDSIIASNEEPVMSVPSMADSNELDMSMGKSFDSKADKVPGGSMPMGKAEKLNAVAKTVKDDYSSLSMGKTSKISGFGVGKAEKMAHSMPSEMDAGDPEDLSMRYGGKAEKTFSMQNHAEQDKEEANEFWLEYDSKAEKNVVLSMDSKAAKKEVKVEKESLSMPSAKALKEAVNSLSLGYGKAEKKTFSMESKADKSPVQSMDTKAAKRESKAEKDALTPPIAKTLKEAVNSLSMGHGKAEKTSFSMESKAHQSPALSMDTKAAKGVSKAEKETLSMPAAKTTKEDGISLSMGYGGKAEKEFSMDAHPRLFSVRKRVQHRRLSASLSYSMSMEGKDVPDSTGMAVEYSDVTEEPVIINTQNTETIDPEEEKTATAEDISESTGEVIDTTMSTNLKSKTSKTTLAGDPMGKAVKGEYSLSVLPKSAKSIAPKAGKAKPQLIMSVNPKAEKLEHSLSVKGSGKAEKERDHSFSFSMKKHALKHRLFDNRKEHNTRRRGVQLR